MHRSIVHLLFFLAAFGTVSEIAGQSYSFQHIGVEEGLSQSVVNCLVQDDDGVMWIGTMSGLTRYDGKEFRVFTNSDGLAENWITSALKDEKGNLWFGHWGGGVSFFDRNLRKFRDMKFERFSQFKTINCMLQDFHGDIWFGTAGAGVFKYEFENNTIVSFSKEDGFQSNNIKSISLDSRNNIWFGTNKGIAIYRTSKKIEEEGAFMLLTSEDGLPSDQITDIRGIGENFMLVGTEIKGLSVIGNASKLNELKYRTLDHSKGLPSNEILCILAIDEDNIWIGTRNEGVIRYNLKNKAIRQLSTKHGLNYFKVNTLFRDREHNIWIGTDLGLNLFRGDEFLIFDETDGILNNMIWSVCEDQQHRLLLGTNKGLSRITFAADNSSGFSEKLEIKNYTTNNGLKNNIILSVYVDHQGDIWCGTGFGGLAIISASNERVRTIDSIRGLASNTVHSIDQDNQNNYWIGTDEGLTRIEQESGKIKNYTVDDGLGGNNIYKVFCDSKGRMWFASIGGFLTKYENEKFTRYDSSSRLSQKFITSVAEDRNGNIWFGAYGGGLFKFDGNEFTNFTTADGLSSNSPYSVISDNFNNLWIGTSQGIDKLNLDDNTVKNYREKEGFMGIEPNPNSVWKDHDGNIWFGTIMGAVRFDMSKEKKNMVEPVTIMRDLKVNYEMFGFPEDNEFAYDENHITFEYIGVSLTNPEHVEYKYMLEGFDHNWSPVTKENDVVYSNIPPGTYTFKVMAANNDGVWNELTTNYTFTITPPFWRTWWFYTLCTVLLISGFYIFVQVRVKSLIVAKQKLEAKVEERTQEIAAKNKELEQKNKDILDSINYARRIQTAMLPSRSRLKEELGHSFIFFRPKDIVSGDFYWMEKVDGKVLFAAADCTGHGVPGAFMSIIGHNGLNKAVIEHGLTKPSEILDLLNDEVTETLKHNENDDVKDGMDISFCTLDKKKMELQYAGAFNPLYLVRNGKLIETKADRRPIGSFAGDKSRKFTNHVIKLKKNDAIYLFSDGFADQFGGPEAKKFRYSRFREILIESHDEDIRAKDEKLEQILDDWRGEIGQIDDIVIIGMKVI